MCLTGLRRVSTAQMAALGLQRAAECMPPGLLRNPTADCSTTHSSNSSAALAFLISSYLCVTISWPPVQFTRFREELEPDGLGRKTIKNQR